MEKTLWRQWNIPLWLIAPVEKAWFYKRFFFEVVMFMVIYSIKYTMSVKINFTHYMKCTRVTLPVGFELVCTFLLFFLFIIIVN